MDTTDLQSWLLLSAIVMPSVVVLAITHWRENAVLRDMIRVWAAEHGLAVQRAQRDLLSSFRISSVFRPIVFKVTFVDANGGRRTGTAVCPNYWFGWSPKELRVELDGSEGSHEE